MEDCRDHFWVQRNVLKLECTEAAEESDEDWRERRGLMEHGSGQSRKMDLIDPWGSASGKLHQCKLRDWKKLQNDTKKTPHSIPKKTTNQPTRQ